jgi:pimeloyl-ACP methyl ester carboxylesterase
MAAGLAARLGLSTTCHQGTAVHSANMTHSTHHTADGRAIAYHYTQGKGPCVVFLGGFKSDMTGTKAQFLQSWAQAQGRAFLRFDYTGHGASSGRFEGGCIGDWARDAIDIITDITTGPLLLVGSSMGGWISLLVARALPDRLAGLVGIAAAPDFTEDSMWAGFSDAERKALMAQGHIALPSDYDEPYIITRKLIEDGRNQLVLRSPLQMDVPVRLLQGSADIDVLPEVAQRLFDHLQGNDIRLTIVKGSDHRFSGEAELALIAQTIEEIIA